MFSIGRGNSEHRPNKASWLTFGGFCLCLFLLYFPVLNLLAAVFREITVTNDLLLSLRQWILFFQSSLFSLLISAAVLTLGFLAALWAFRLPVFLRWLPLVLLAVPPYIHALGWMQTFQWVNRMLTAFGLVRLHWSGWGTAGIVQVFYLLPLAYGVCLFGLDTLNHDLITAAGVFANGGRVLKRIIIPLLSPFLVIGYCLCFLMGYLDYSIPYLFGVTGYALEIFASYSANPNIIRAVILSVPLFLISLLVLLILVKQIRNIPIVPDLRQNRKNYLPVWPRSLNWLIMFVIGLLMVQVLVPIYVSMQLTGSLENFIRSVSDGFNEAVYSLSIALITAVIAVPVSYAAAKWSQSNRMWIMMFLPLCIPPSLTGIAMIHAWNRPGWDLLYNTDWMPVLTHLARFLPFAFLMNKAVLNRQDQALVDIGMIFQPSPWKRRLWVDLPLVSPGLISGFFLVFVFSMGELAASLLVLPPGRSNLTLRIFNFLHYGSPEMVAGLSLLNLLFTFLGGLFALVLLYVWLRSLKKN